VLSLAILLMVMDILLEESALELDFTQLALSMNPDPPRDLVREVLMLNQDIIHRTIGLQLSLHMDPQLAMDAVARGVLNLDILAMAMDIQSVLSVLELVFTLLVQSMNPDQRKVLAEDTCTRFFLLLCNLF